MSLGVDPQKTVGNGDPRSGSLSQLTASQRMEAIFNECWSRRSEVFPEMEKSEFFSMLGVEPEVFFVTHFSLIDELPGLQEIKFVSCGGSGGRDFGWSFEARQDVPGLKNREVMRSDGRGSREEAAIESLLTLYEMRKRRLERHESSFASVLSDTELSSKVPVYVPSVEMADLFSKIWNAKPSLSNTDQQAFFDFVGVGREQFFSTHFTSYDELPGLKARGIVSLGGSTEYTGDQYSWRFFACQDSEGLNRRDAGSSHRPSKEEAALAALLTLYELRSLRLGASAN